MPITVICLIISISGRNAAHSQTLSAMAPLEEKNSADGIPCFALD